MIRETDPHVYHGYIYLASPIVRLMREYTPVARFVSIFGKAWARDMAGDTNFLGRIVHKVGYAVCDHVGKLMSKPEQYGT